MIWLYDNIEMRIEGRIIVRVFPAHAPTLEFEHTTPVVSGWTMNRKKILRVRVHFRTLATSPFSVLDSRVWYKKC